MGKMGSGKTQASSYLAEKYGASTWTVAERIKEVSHALVDQSGQLDVLLHAVVPDAEHRRAAVYELLRFSDGYQLESGKPRKLYQEVGQILRDLHPTTRLCWEEDLERRIQVVASKLTVIDVRSQEGYKFFVQDRGYIALRIDAPLSVRKRRLLERDTFAVVDQAVFDHQSETDVDALSFDVTIDNGHANLDKLNKDLDSTIKAFNLLSPPGN
jgi:dephospho-CoA kinase